MAVHTLAQLLNRWNGNAPSSLSVLLPLLFLLLVTPSAEPAEASDLIEPRAAEPTGGSEVPDYMVQQLEQLLNHGEDAGTTRSAGPMLGFNTHSWTLFVKFTSCTVLKN